MHHESPIRHGGHCGNRVARQRVFERGPNLYDHHYGNGYDSNVGIDDYGNGYDNNRYYGNDHNARG